jgi:hypothetical protein
MTSSKRLPRHLLRVAADGAGSECVIRSDALPPDWLAAIPAQEKC